MNVVITLLFEADSLTASELRWPLRVALDHGGKITFVVSAIGGAAQTRKVDLTDEKGKDDPVAHELVTSLRALLDQELTPEGWVASAQPSPETEAGTPGAGDRPIQVDLLSIPTEQIVSVVLPLVDDASRDLLVAVVEELPRELTEWRAINRELLRDTSCQYVSVIPGTRQADGEILVRPSRGIYLRAATPLAVALAKRHQRTATALWIEPEIGPDSGQVGHQMLDRMLKSSLGEQETELARRVEIQNSAEDGILQACADDRYEVFMMGVSRPIDGGFAVGRLPLRIARGTNEPTLIFARAALPMRTRIQRLLDSNLRRIVPQLERGERIDFVERVQSSSEWNFDFVALMGLATGIATFGLVGDSGAVIIGAMLVAPLMTPLLGLGLSIVQGNSRLASMTAKTAFLGFLLAFVIALAIGALNPEFGLPTSEMYARHWPTLVDVSIAFVAGLAAAYASGRPGLLAALPGVAIAASLVPPIAVSGLALSIAHYDLAIGAILLFAVNVVAIVFASSVTLWGVGLQSRTGFSLKARLLAAGLAVITVAMAIAVAASPPMSEPPLRLIEEIEAAIGEENRLRTVHLRREDGRAILQIDIGGPIQDHPAFGAQLIRIARTNLGDNAVVRVTYRHETILH